MNKKKHTKRTNNGIYHLGPRRIRNVLFAASREWDLCVLELWQRMEGVVIHGGSCLDEEERVYAVEVLRLGVDRFTPLPVV